MTNAEITSNDVFGGYRVPGVRNALDFDSMFDELLHGGYEASEVVVVMHPSGATRPLDETETARINAALAIC